MENPYYAVIFTSEKNTTDLKGYESMSQKMMELAQQQAGYIGVDSVRGEDGKGITISYWQTLEDIKSWRANTEHLEAQKLGRSKWYSAYKIKICKVEREY